MVYLDCQQAPCPDVGYDPVAARNLIAVQALIGSR